MPPKKTIAKTILDHDATASVANEVTLNASEVEFLVQCLGNPMGGGTVTVNCAAVANVRGQSNPRSVANRLGVFKRRFGIPLVAGNTSGSVDVAAQDNNGGSDDDDDAGGAASPAKPARKTPVKRKTPAGPRKGKKVKVETSTDDFPEVEAQESPGSQFTTINKKVEADKEEYDEEVIVSVD